MSHNKQSTNDDGIIHALDTVMVNVLEDMDAFLPPLPPSSFAHVLPIQNNTNHPTNRLQSICADMSQLKIQQMATLASLTLNHLNVYSNQINNNQNQNFPNNINMNDNNQYSYGITPNTSYNSLASLDTVTSTSSTNYPQYDVKENVHNGNTVNNLYGCCTKIQEFESSSYIKLQLKDYVFVSKDCTRRLGQYIVRENWGKDYGLLYKYLDYIFRCQAFKRQIIEVNDKYLIFHSGLQRRFDNQLLYVLLVPNKKYVSPKWRTIKNSFLSKQEILSKFSEPYVVEEYLPQRTRFATNLSQLLYDGTYTIDVDWAERLMTNKDRLCKVLGTTKLTKLPELVQAFDDALRQTQRIGEINPRVGVPQGFVDSKHCKYRVELLLPLVIEFPRYSCNYYAFALAIAKSSGTNEKKYIAKSILTLEMAYANARLVGYVDSSWLHYGNSNNAKINMNIHHFFLQNNSP